MRRGKGKEEGRKKGGKREVKGKGDETGSTVWEMIKILKESEKSWRHSRKGLVLEKK